LWWGISKPKKKVTWAGGGRGGDINHTAEYKMALINLCERGRKRGARGGKKGPNQVEGEKYISKKNSRTCKIRVQYVLKKRLTEVK